MKNKEEKRLKVPLEEFRRIQNMLTTLLPNGQAMESLNILISLAEQQKLNHWIEGK